MKRYQNRSSITMRQNGCGATTGGAIQCIRDRPVVAAGRAPARAGSVQRENARGELVPVAIDNAVGTRSVRGRLRRKQGPLRHDRVYDSSLGVWLAKIGNPPNAGLCPRQRSVWPDH